MKPKNLKFPFSWEERKPLLAGGVLYIPRYYFDHASFPKEEMRDLFSSFSSINVEYCSGNGAWIAEKAAKDPSTLWIAVEKRFDRVQKLWSKKENLSLDNLFIVCGDAITFTREYLEENSIDGIFVNFPDPWPKDKHAKNRLFKRDFIEEMKRVSKEGGEALLVTDDEDYSLQMIEEMTGEGLFTSLLPAPFYVTEWKDYGSSFFEELWRGKGKGIRYLQFAWIK
jgi:tRNA (guanine-N7-)-methyltransferase